MAEKTFHCKLITPEACVLDNEVTSVVFPQWDGQVGVLPKRAPLMSKMGLGELRIKFAEGGTRSYLLEGGFAQMVDNNLTMLAEGAHSAETLSEQEAQAELAEAEARSPQDAKDMARVTHDRRRAKLKLELARRFREQGGGV